METKPKQDLFNVYLRKQWIDGVFYNKGITCEEVKESLVNHDGYNPNIIVRKG